MCLYSDNSKGDHRPFDNNCLTKAGDKSNKIIDHTDANMPRNTSAGHVSRRSQSNKGQQQTSGKKQYQCQVCERCFEKKLNQQCHMRIHTSEKPYQCKVCAECFAQSQTFKNHMRVHTGEKPYQCQICDESFAKSQNLNNHLRVHTGEKPYQCKICDKRFSLSET